MTIPALCRAVRGLPAALCALVAWPAGANDSTAVLGTGGLTLTRTDAIAMEREDLYLSADAIRVSYRFRNVTGSDIETIVAFPLPPLETGELSYVPVAPPSNDPVNFVDFRVTVDGAPVAPAVERRAIAPDGSDVTALIEAAGASLSIFEPGWWERLVALPEPMKRKLIDRGLLEWMADYQEVYTHWTVETRFWWEQRFPAGAVVTVEHSYAPVAGTSFFSNWDLDDPERLAHWQSAYCFDDAVIAGLRRRLRAQEQEYPMLVVREVDYVLTTGANWAGPIGTFHLTVDKGSTDAIVSLCAPDIEKTGPTTFELTRTDFWPTRDLSIAVFTPLDPAVP